MTGNAFTVTFVPLYCESASEPLKPGLLSESTVNTLNEIYSVMNKKFLTTMHNSRVAERIKGSFFCCCFADGMTMFTFKINEVHLIMSGYFIPLDCLKTAWRVFKKELVYISAVGCEFSKDEKYTVGAEQIYEWADRAKARLDEELSAQVEAVVRDTAKEGTPFSFAKTGLPTDMFPVYFESRAVGSSVSADSDEDGMIILSSNNVRDMSLIMNKKVPAAGELYLCETSGKKYAALKKEELKLELSKSEFKNEAKTLDTKPELQRERLWYFKVSDRNGLAHTEPLETPFQSELCLPQFDFQVLPHAMISTGNLIQKAHSRGSQDSSEEKTKKRIGLSGLFGHKK